MPPTTPVRSCAAGRAVPLARLDFGVAIFFVLSGFLLSRPTFISLASRRAAPGRLHYFWKRALRILPLYWLVVTVALLFDPANQGLGAEVWVRQFTLTQLYFPGLLPQSLTQMWSLCTEVAFYLLLPVICWLLTRRPAATAGSTSGRFDPGRHPLRPRRRLAGLVRPRPGQRGPLPRSGFRATCRGSSSAWHSPPSAPTSRSFPAPHVLDRHGRRPRRLLDPRDRPLRNRLHACRRASDHRDAAGLGGRHQGRALRSGGRALPAAPGVRSRAGRCGS